MNQTQLNQAAQILQASAQMIAALQALIAMGLTGSIDSDSANLLAVKTLAMEALQAAGVTL